ncbi:hypothetical protein [Benzoatithermus flavus]|uniref:Uncharacterized protein n=1 Tax=Benzoatithermus flavus TaxID=3108223 RepID=A0ABU8XLF4_9PROT
MMCRPEERDLEHAARRAIAAARAAGHVDAALIEAATDEVAAIWAHIDRAVIRAAVQAAAAAEPPDQDRGTC